MTQLFDTSTIEKLSAQLKEPSWLTKLRLTAWQRHGKLPWPHPSDDIWRRTDISLLNPLKGFTLSDASAKSPSSVHEEFAEYVKPLGDEYLSVRINGQWVKQDFPQGMKIEDLQQAVLTQPEPLRRLLEVDGLTEAEQKLTTLNEAFHHDDLSLHVPANFVADKPIRLLHIFSAQPHQALFPLTIIRVGAGSRLTLIDEYISTAPEGAPHLINGRIELVLEPDASVHYVRLQRWSNSAREFLLQRTTLAKGASLTSANINLGAALSKAHVVNKFMGEGASAKLYGFVFGHGTQHIDQHTLQDHQAPHTFSDLQFLAALQDSSRMVYTGLIRIAKAAQQTNAFQSNHNLMLSQKAHAETIPMLEILADDVQCKHAASVGPIDDEQTFYLMSRGISREVAQRLIVMGFIEPVVSQVPFAPLQERLRQEIEGNLHY